jgi:RNA polymerase sigma factor (sigma-70 family)
LLRAQSDYRLLELAREGHERAFEALVRRYHKPLLAYGRRLLPAAVAEDAVQQSLLQAWQALQRGTEVRDLGPWLHRIVYHSAIRMQRRPFDELAPVAPAPTVEAPHVHLERRMAAREALAGVAALPELQREALVQTALDGRSHQQVAETLGLTDGAVRGLLYRARTRLRAAAAALTPLPLREVGGLSDVGGRAGGAGVAAVLGKGGAIAISAGVIVAGTATMHSKLGRVHAGPGSVRATALPGAVAPGADADLSVGSTFGATAKDGDGADAGALNGLPGASTRPAARSSGRWTESQARPSAQAVAVSRADHPAGVNGASGGRTRPTKLVFVRPAGRVPGTGSASTSASTGTRAPAAGGASSGSSAAAPASARSGGGAGAGSKSDNAGEQSASPSSSGATATAASKSQGADNTNENQSGATTSPGASATGAAASGAAAKSSDTSDDGGGGAASGSGTGKPKPAGGLDD